MHISLTPFTCMFPLSSVPPYRIRSCSSFSSRIDRFFPGKRGTLSIHICTHIYVPTIVSPVLYQKTTKALFHKLLILTLFIEYTFPANPLQSFGIAELTHFDGPHICMYTYVCMYVCIVLYCIVLPVIDFSPSIFFNIEDLFKRNCRHQKR